MANTLVVDDSSVAALNYFDSSFAVPIYDSRMTDTYYESFFPVSKRYIKKEHILKDADKLILR